MYLYILPELWITTSTGNSSKFILILDVLSRPYTARNARCKLQSYRISRPQLLDRPTCAHMVCTWAVKPPPPGHARSLHNPTHGPAPPQQVWCFSKVFDLQHVHTVTVQSAALWSFYCYPEHQNPSLLYITSVPPIKGNYRAPTALHSAGGL